MKKTIINIFILFVMFSNAFFTNINLPGFFGYWDELTELIIIFFGIYHLCAKHGTKVKKKYFYTYLLLFILIFIGLMGNIVFKYASSTNAIFRDIIAFIKFPLIFIILTQINIETMFEESLTKTFINIIKAIIIIIFVLGIISLFKDIGLSQNEIRYGIRPYMFVFSHPTYLVLSSLFLLLFIDTIEYKFDRKYLLYEIMLLANIFLSMRTKGIVLAALYIFIKYAGKWLKKFKVLYWSGAGILALATVYDKLALYSSYSSSPREALYKGAILLIKKCFPFGSGFATYASHISGKFYSTVYDFIKIPFYWTEAGNEMDVLGDAGFAYYIGQFGLIGTILFICTLYYLYKISKENVKNILPITILWIYILIALTTESTLLNNGIEVAIMLSYFSTLNKRKKI